MNLPFPGDRPGTRSEPAALKQLMRRKRKAESIRRFANREDALEHHYDRHYPGWRGARPQPSGLPQPIGPARDWLAPVLAYLDKLLRPNPYA